MTKKPSNICHYPCKICGVLAVPHEHPRIDGMHEYLRVNGMYNSNNKPNEEGEWWEKKAKELFFVDEYTDEDKFNEAVGCLIAESEKRGAIKAATDIRKRILDYIEKEKDSTLNKGEADALRAVLLVISDTYKESLMK